MEFGISIERFSSDLNRGVEYLLVAMGLSMATIVAAQVFYRYALNASLFWSEELARHLLVWMTFLGASTAYRRRAHPGVDMVTTRLPAPMRRRVEVAVHWVCLAVFAVMVVYGIEFSWFVRLQISPALNLPKWLLFGIVPISGAVCIVHALAFLALPPPGGSK